MADIRQVFNKEEGDNRDDGAGKHARGIAPAGKYCQAYNSAQGAQNQTEKTEIFIEHGPDHAVAAFMECGKNEAGAKRKHSQDQGRKPRSPEVTFFGQVGLEAAVKIRDKDR